MAQITDIYSNDKSSNSATLESKTNQFVVVINKPNRLSIDEYNKCLISLNENLERNAYLYACLNHDLDTDSEGKTKTFHTHYVIWGNKRCRLRTMLWRIGDYLGFLPSEILNISIDRCNDIAYSIQYLTHKNDINKYQYNYMFIITNISENDLLRYYNKSTYDEITTDRLFKLIVDEKKTDLELMYILGLSRYSYYFKCIQQIRFVTRNSDELAYVRNLAKMYGNGELK